MKTYLHTYTARSELMQVQSSHLINTMHASIHTYKYEISCYTYNTCIHTKKDSKMGCDYDSSFIPASILELARHLVIHTYMYVSRDVSRHTNICACMRREKEARQLTKRAATSSRHTYVFLYLLSYIHSCMHRKQARGM